MRRLSYLGAALLLVGAVLLVVGSGGFDMISGDRGVQLQTAEEEQNALLGVEYPSADRTVALESDDADGGGGCFFGICSQFRYNDETVVVFADNTGSEELAVDQLDIAVDNDDLTRNQGVRAEQNGDVIRLLLGDFRCPSSGGFGTGSQEERSGTVTVDLTVSDGLTTIEVERQIDVECVPD